MEKLPKLEAFGDSAVAAIADVSDEQIEGAATASQPTIHLHCAPPPPSTFNWGCWSIGVAMREASSSDPLA